MYYIEKTMEISACHCLKLSYESKCQNLHGHNWIITVYCKSSELNKDGMVVDFTHIKRLVSDRLDHASPHCSSLRPETSSYVPQAGGTGPYRWTLPYAKSRCPRD